MQNLKYGFIGNQPPAGVMLRCCRTPDRRRVVAAWAFYEDIKVKYPVFMGWDIPETPLPAPFEIRHVENKGRGMIATRNIKRGEVIVRERPILMAPHVTFEDARCPWKTLEGYLLQMLYWLDQKDRERVVELHNCKSLDECGPLAGIMRTNALNFSFPDARILINYGAICLNISYVNHSCVPNSSYDCDRDAMICTLRALRDIAAGEEITITYIDKGMPFMDRQAELQAKYSFKCDCSLCTSPTHLASEKRRKFITSTLDSLEVMWNDWLGCPARQKRAKLKQDLETVNSLLRAMDEEKQYDRRLEVYEHLAFAYAVLCDLENFKTWGRECLKELARGKQNETNAAMTADWEGWLANPTTIPMWNALR